MPVPAPVAVKTVPSVLLAEPMAVKSVSPALKIVYETPAMNAPAVSVLPEEKRGRYPLAML